MWEGNFDYGKFLDDWNRWYKQPYAYENGRYFVGVDFAKEEPDVKTQRYKIKHR